MMKDNLILLDERKLSQLYHDKKIDVRVLQSVDSTNDYLKSYPLDQATHICLAERQTKGKGRLEREWYSPFGENIYFSCRYFFNKTLNELSGLSLVVSLSILKTLKQHHIPDLFVKWPNDVLHHHQKLSGSLIEIGPSVDGGVNVIIGIGINVNMMNDDHRISQQWTSLQKISGKIFDRNDLVASLIYHLLYDLAHFNEKGFGLFKDEWERAELLMGQLIEIKNNNQIISGIVRGVNTNGHLMLEVSHGKISGFAAGEATILKNK